MLTRRTGYLQVRDDEVPAESTQLQSEGWAVLREVFAPDEVDALADDITRVFDELRPDVRVDSRPVEQWTPFRYEMLNRSAVCQKAIAHQHILSVIEPLLGEDCHVIANTAWRQAPDEESQHGGRNWHLDAGPHIPRPADVPWDPRIPYPIFAIAAHLFLIDCPLESGPTGVIPGSHMSGQAPPRDRAADVTLTWNGIGAMPIIANAGDVALFVSDVWHRRLPSLAGDPGRFFLQVHYARRDLAQRLRTTAVANQLADATIERAITQRDRTLIGLHEPRFYDG